MRFLAYLTQSYGVLEYVILKPYRDHTGVMSVTAQASTAAKPPRLMKRALGVLGPLLQSFIIFRRLGLALWSSRRRGLVDASENRDRGL